MGETDLLSKQHHAGIGILKSFHINDSNRRQGYAGNVRRTIKKMVKAFGGGLTIDSDGARILIDGINRSQFDEITKFIGDLAGHYTANYYAPDSPESNEGENRKLAIAESRHKAEIQALEKRLTERKENEKFNEGKIRAAEQQLAELKEKDKKQQRHIKERTIQIVSLETRLSENTALTKQVRQTNSMTEAYLNHIENYVSRANDINELINGDIFNRNHEVHQLAQRLNSLGIQLSSEGEEGLAKILDMYSLSEEPKNNKSDALFLCAYEKTLPEDKIKKYREALEESDKNIKILPELERMLECTSESTRKHLIQARDEAKKSLNEHNDAINEFNSKFEKYKENVRNLLSECQNFLQKNTRENEINRLLKDSRLDRYPVAIELSKNEKGFNISIYAPSSPGPILTAILGEHIFQKIYHGLDSETLAGASESTIRDGKVKVISIPLPEASYKHKDALSLLHSIEDSLYEGYQHTSLREYGITPDIALNILPDRLKNTPLEKPEIKARKKYDRDIRLDSYLKILAENGGSATGKQIMDSMRERIREIDNSILYRDMALLAERELIEISRDKRRIMYRIKNNNDQKTTSTGV